MPSFCRADPSLSTHDNACRVWFSPSEERTVRELSQLSSKDREQVWADLSGNGIISQYEIKPEEPHFLQEKLLQLEDALSRIDEKPSFEVARQQSPTYVYDQKLRLMFLRADSFNANAAAERLVRHFAMKESLFGKEKLTRDISLSDLDENDLACLRCGALQCMDERDAAGRPVFFSRYAELKYHDRMNANRVLWFMGMQLVKDENAQKTGVVSVVYLVDDYPAGGVDHEFSRWAIKMTGAIPIRVVAIYIALKSTLWKPAVDLGILMFSPFLRVRTRAVCGTDMECIYLLMCLGIPPSAVPVASQNGSTLRDAFNSWLDTEWKKLES